MEMAKNEDEATRLHDLNLQQEWVFKHIPGVQLVATLKFSNDLRGGYIDMVGGSI